MSCKDSHFQVQDEFFRSKAGTLDDSFPGLGDENLSFDETMIVQDT